MRKTITNYISLAFFLLCMLPNVSLSACSCGEFPTFCEKAVNYNLFLGRVVGQQLATPINGGLDGVFTNLEVINPMNSEGIVDTVSMINQDGFNCNGSIYNLAIGDTVVISIVDLENGFDVIEGYDNVPHHRKYNLFGCGTYFLEVINGQVGGITSNQIAVSLADFLLSPQENCPIVTSTENPLAGSIRLYPNPVVDQLRIQNQGETMINGSLTDLNGALIRQFRISAGDVEELPLSDLPSGTYVIRLDDGLRSHSEMVVRQ